MTLTPRTCIEAAQFLGDAETERFCSTGISNAGEAQLVALVLAAIDRGMVTA